MEGLGANLEKSNELEVVHMASLFESLYESLLTGELILKEGGICQYHRYRRDPGVVSIYTIISTRPGLGSEMLNQIKSLPGVREIRAYCPVDLDANEWYQRQGFQLVSARKVKSGRQVNFWCLYLDPEERGGDSVMSLTTLRALRLEAGKTLREVSDESGVSVSEISLIERRIWKPSKKALEKLGAVFQVDPDKLLQPYAEFILNESEKSS